MCGLEFACSLFVLTAALAPRPNPRKALGQHFLSDNRIVARIIAAADLGPQEVVVEVGPGRGALTRRLVQSAGRVIAIEKDPQLAASLAARLSNPANLVTAEDDARTADIATLVGPGAAYKVVANLPYYAANPIIRRFLESEPKPAIAVVMVQREVAQSMAAAPGSMSLLSVAVQFYARPRIVCQVPPRAFHPPPKVSSSVVRLDVLSQPALEVKDPQGFFDFVRAGFSAPRKQLRNSLGQGLRASGELAGEILASANVDARRRAETLALEEWGQLYQAWLALDGQ